VWIVSIFSSQAMEDPNQRLGKGEDRLSLNTINNEKFQFMHWRSNMEKLSIFQDLARASVTSSEQTHNTRWKLNETEGPRHSSGG
jgi:hypothetical protein